ncbi:Flavodoxin-like fold [Mesorhizobium sp. NFR06]|jgi:putative NADPH-quinone reductase|uniref:NAD(P)H-dependent oxidoreductase n=1 Tax=Mesorhizobium sp. NFR06 TaxID=1566290 RepID=UPI0008EE3D3C|nr:NAD(P)H-dependent oxidoreductase [Mesorhizobium sp. NFR06]SFQ04682.1 Flavodoxin-like fold [Mesorhizobium sp. NFR06]
MRIFIVHAHPEPDSFNGALTRAAQEALAAAGHEVVVSDLYAMAFNPVSDRRNVARLSTRVPDFVALMKPGSGGRHVREFRTFHNRIDWDRSTMRSAA